jgi:hypothetical protein
MLGLVRQSILLFSNSFCRNSPFEAEKPELELPEYHILHPDFSGIFNQDHLS